MKLEFTNFIAQFDVKHESSNLWKFRNKNSFFSLELGNMYIQLEQQVFFFLVL